MRKSYKKSQNANIFAKIKTVFVPTLGGGHTLLPKLKEDIEPVEDEVWSMGRHCHVLNNQQPPPFTLAAWFANRK